VELVHHGAMGMKPIFGIPASNAIAGPIAGTGTWMEGEAEEDEEDENRT
jgi:hypothetical protein